MTLSGHSILKQCKDFWPISPAKKKIHSTLLMLDGVSEPLLQGAKYYYKNETANSHAKLTKNHVN